MANDRAYGRQYGRDRAEDPQEIGPPPEVVNPERRERCEASLERFLKIYFPWAFTMKWSRDHIRVIEQIERAVVEGGLFALAMPRGTGKTTICERAALWAILTGRRKFVTLVGATEKHAEAILKSQMTELQHNEFLFEDFPEVTYPIRKLENEPRRCKGQKCLGQGTNIVWTASQLVLATLPDELSKAGNGGVVSVCGITGAVRGQKHTTTKGVILRPSFVLVDDPQTDESARSDSQCAARESVLSGALLNMAGPGQKISAVMPCTVIRRGDMADNILNRRKHPDWNGERTKMLKSLPTNQAAIDEYADLRARLFMEERSLKEANKYWRKNRAVLEEGAEAAWPERKMADEVSAIQHAVNLMLRDRPAFFAEYQNEPVEEETKAERLLLAEEICRKVNGIDRGQLAGEWSHVTAMIDVQQDVLFWIVCGWGDGFSGGVLDYGAYPDQGRNYFRLNDLSLTLRKKFDGMSPEAAIYAGLGELTTQLCSRTFMRQDGTALKIDRLLIDEGYQADVIHQFCRATPFNAIIMPSKGFGVKAGNKPLNEYEKRQGDKAGVHCRVSTAPGRTIRHLLIDTNHWKSFVFSRFAAPMGGAGCLSLFGRDPVKHRMFADHMKAEFCVKTFGRGREVTEWAVKPGKPDNHWFDCLVGSACVASMLGCSLTGQAMNVFQSRKPRVPLAQMGR